MMDVARAAAWRLEEQALNAWPALQTALVEGWLLRFAEGYSKRANSACALPGAAGLALALPAIEEQYGRRGIPCCVRLTPFAPAGAAGLLAQRGWTPVDETLVQVADLAGPGMPSPPGSGFVVAEEAGPDWIDGYARASARPDLKRDTLRRMLASIGTPAAFARLVVDGEDVAYGMAVLDRGAVGLFDIATPAAHRGRGHARRLVAGLLDWGKARGASSAYLQVTAGNAAALALYRRFGFAEAYRYLYFLAP